MKMVGLYDAKSKLSALIAELETGKKPIAITRHGRIVAEIHPHQPGHLPQRGFLKSNDFHIAADFDEPETGFEDFFEKPTSIPRVAEEPNQYRV
ncbi:MAG: type II toxin-antitoxin system Phd/YefM family antitoxin [Verrucomicrobiota bacterium]